jgi:hypothetical protein
MDLTPAMKSKRAEEVAPRQYSEYRIIHYSMAAVSLSSPSPRTLTGSRI